MNCKKMTRATIWNLSVLMILSACSGTATDQNASSRYHMRAEFTANRDVLAVELLSDGSYSLAFKPYISAHVNPFGSAVLSREWVITEAGENYYRITNRWVGNGLSLDVVNDGVFDSLSLAPSDDVSGQHWRITTLENGYCRFTTEFLGEEMALDITSDTDASELTIRPAGDFSGQHWQLTQLGMGGLLDENCRPR